MNINKRYIPDIVLAVVISVSAVLYLIFGHIAFKATASIGFVVMGIVNYAIVRKNIGRYRKFSLILLCGLFCAMVGDIVLNYNFIAGAGIFAVGHLFFFIAQCFMRRPDRKALITDIICIACWLLITSAILFFAPLNFNSSLMFGVCLGYAAVISVMTGKALSNFVQTRRPLYTHLLVGTTAFLLSDIMLVFNVFGERMKITNILCIVLYYFAEMALANVFFPAEKQAMSGNDA